MKTFVHQIDPTRPDPALLRVAAEVLRRGGTVVIPTETVYGLAARADDRDAVAKIFEAKGRPAYNPLIVHGADLAGLAPLARRWPAHARVLAEALWPGPLTLVLPRDRAAVPDIVTGGGDSVALRIPAHPVALGLIRIAELCLAAPSANRFQALSPTTAEHALKGLDGRVDLVLDGGPCAHGIESTVVDCSGDIPIILRPGALASEAMRALVGALLDGPADAQEIVGAPLPSPGMIRKHYAPRAPLSLVRSDALDEAVASLGHRVGVVTHARSEVRGAFMLEALPSEPRAYAARLYAALHALDDVGCDTVLVEEVPSSAGWEAVRDRLSRASS